MRKQMVLIWKMWSEVKFKLRRSLPFKGPKDGRGNCSAKVLRWEGLEVRGNDKSTLATLEAGDGSRVGQMVQRTCGSGV